MQLKAKIIKLTRWEHWPTFMYYLPLVPYYLYQSIKNKSFTFFLLTNPAIHYSGNGTESKYKTIQLVPKKYRPKSILLNKPTPLKIVLEKLKNKKISFPLIAKPDLGFRGFLVKKIDSENALKEYLDKNNSVAIILQEFISLPKECGIFYYRLPTEKTGKITSITLKKFLTVVGNGKSTLSELILADSRAFLYYDLFKKIHINGMNTIIDLNKKITLSVIGNHSKGTEFLNGNYLITKELEKTFDIISNEIEGWFFGRLDIKYQTFEELVKGENFKILEINGIIAEPTHIYDATVENASYFVALKEIKRNWEIITKIAKINKKELGLKNPKLFPYIKELAFLRKHTREIKRLNATN